MSKADGFRTSVNRAMASLSTTDTRRPAMTATDLLVKEAIEAWPQFDGDREVSGADLVEWFESWRRRAKAIAGPT